MSIVQKVFGSVWIIYIVHMCIKYNKVDVPSENRTDEEHESECPNF